MTLTAAERRDRLRLFRTDYVGPATFRGLLEHFGSASAALDALPALARRSGRKLSPCPPAKAEQEMADLEKLGACLVVWGDPEYPVQLAAAEDAPPAFSVRGDVTLLSRPCLAMVGARNASLNGRRLAQALAAGLGEAGYVVVSGVARGIDAAAHEGALKTGTVGVIAGGIDVVYPEENRALHGRIAAEGALITEMPPGTVPQARHFPQRNRIISGLSLGTVVVEAALRSGSLITARQAADQGREVFAVPGSPLDPRARGTNDLLRNGATLVEEAADIIAALSGLRPAPTTPSPAIGVSGSDFKKDIQDIESATKIVMECLGPSPVPIDEIVRRCHLSPAVVSLVLLEIELAGRLERHAGNSVSLL